MPMIIRVLFVHGVNTDETNLAVRRDIETVVQAQFALVGADVTVEFDYHLYNTHFVAAPPCAADYIETIASGLWGGIASLFGARAFATEADAGPDGTFKRTAGMVAQWVSNDNLRKTTRIELADRIKAFRPHLVLAHSLGSLIAYDTLADKKSKDLLATGMLTVFGSQIANPLLSTEYAGRLRAPPVRHAFQLFNRYDTVFTAKMPDHAGFTVLSTDFDEDNGHSWKKYLSAPRAAPMWRAAASLVATGAAKQLFAASLPRRKMVGRSARRRALLVGINEYPDPASRLAGCVNDVFLVSSVLQECGFDAEDVRVVLDGRATADGIRQRLEWLVGDARDGDQLVFYYSGHGAQIPGYNLQEQVDHVDECLVPWDFDWSPEKAILDDQLAQFYSNLPYDCRFTMILDCCHSGGMSRNGASRVRGITPPDDIRHRALRWNQKHRMWVPRDFKELSRDKSLTPAYTGGSPGLLKLGRAMRLRQLPQKKYDQVRKKAGHYGPYLPMIIEACGESQFSYEYTHGSISHGVFTFCMAKQLRDSRQVPTYEALVRTVGKEIAVLGYDQKPQILGPSAIISAGIPWRC